MWKHSARVSGVRSMIATLLAELHVTFIRSPEAVMVSAPHAFLYVAGFELLHLSVLTCVLL